MGTWVILASGPCMCAEDADYVRGKAQVLVINTTFRLAPWADALYTNDHDWLRHYLPELRKTFAGDLWCGHFSFAHKTGVRHIPFDKDAIGLDPKPGHIAWGMNSGGAALSLLVNHLQAQRVILLGYTQKWPEGGKPRWHGAHPAHLQNQKPGFWRWAAWFQQAALDAQALGVEILNASRDSTLTCFERVELREVL
jgi:hypothetical protein